MMFVELFQTDGLTVMGRGLGIERLFTKFLLCYSDPVVDAALVLRNKKLVLCLNTMGHEQCFRELLLSEGARPDALPQVSSRKTQLWSGS